jgi:hypothetical protein
MPAQFRTSGTTAHPVLPGSFPKPKERGERLLSQARLDRISQPTRVFFLTWVRWFLRIRSDPQTYHAEMLKEKAGEMGSRIARLKQQVLNPAPELTAEAWEQLETQLQKAWGISYAIEDNLRERRTRRPTPLVSAGSVPTSPPSPPTTPESDSADPFRDE